MCKIPSFLEEVHLKCPLKSIPWKGYHEYGHSGVHVISTRFLPISQKGPTHLLALQPRHFFLPATLPLHFAPFLHHSGFSSHDFAGENKNLNIRCTSHLRSFAIGLSQILQETAMVNYECDMIMQR